jgi:transcriptional regulator with XRE-family HTH domain
MTSFGQILKTERERRGLDLDAVAEATKIRKLYLNALEEDDFDQLPPRVYATGFVAIYAGFLKMDVDSLVKEFKARAYVDPPEPPPPTEAVAKKKVRKRIIKRGRNQKIPVRNIVAALMFLLAIWWLGGYLAAYIGQQGVNKQSVVQTDPVTPSQEVIPNNPQVKPVTDQILLVISAQQKCWLEVKVDGVNIYEGTMAIGEQKSFEGKTSIAIRAGNAGGITLTLNDKKLAPLGAVGQVVEKTFNLSSIGKE